MLPDCTVFLKFIGGDVFLGITDQVVVFHWQRQEHGYDRPQSRNNYQNNLPVEIIDFANWCFRKGYAALEKSHTVKY
jgi:hypothetical protein